MWMRIYFQSCREWVDVDWTNKVVGLFLDLIRGSIWKQVEEYKRVAHPGRSHSLMKGTASSFLAVVSAASLASMAFLSPTANMASPITSSGRGAAVADKRALQLQVFTKLFSPSFYFGQSVADRGASQSRFFRDKLDVFFLSPSPFLDHEESGWFHGRAMGVMLGWRLVNTAGQSWLLLLMLTSIQCDEWENSGPNPPLKKVVGS